MNRLTEEQRNWLDDLGIFRELPQETRALIAAAAEPTLFKLGEVVVREGESAESFFIVERGKARVVTEGDDGRKVTLATLEPGDSFGEQSLLFNRPAGASVRAATGLLLIAIPADTFRRVAQTHPAFRVQLEARIRQHSEFNLLRKLNVLSSLSLKDAQELATSIVRVELKPGDVLFHEGEEADAAYSIVDGRIRILKESANNTLMAVLGPGALIGEMALLHDAPRSAAAVAAGEQKVQLLRLGREEFLRIVSSRDAEQVLVKQASNRLQQQQSFLDDITEVRSV
jgi:CRP-like cAMP-binding protein